MRSRYKSEEFTIWIVTRADMRKFLIFEILFSSALYAGLKTINGHDLIAMIGSSVGTNFCKRWPSDRFPSYLFRRKDLQVMSWAKQLPLYS
ncbi:hypothetical protein [Paenibacillus pini]|uniref:Uncharacterized protein n=1 Tax=Paenibacillus pini JCM 16418 TaxID=1236976 RepID=W7Z520_9BACL|nr:hypothetical protein [Paenibacillus pini]GAF09429.1 hypothetical protein JCM16418_3570 [Paenibacillus pini JCM 16418]